MLHGQFVGSRLAWLRDSRQAGVRWRIPGYSGNDCHPIEGDHLSTPVRWTGGPVAPGSAVKVRFLLKRAFLYGFDTEEKLIDTEEE